MRFENISFEAAFGTSDQLPESDRPEVAFAGRSNVGKSSLLNRLAGRKLLARVSSKPGKTVTVNFYNAGDVMLADLPGYGYAKVSQSEKERFGELMEAYFNSGRKIVLVVLLIDMRHPPTVDDDTMINFLVQKSLPFIIVLTKSDKLNKSERARHLETIKNELGSVGANCTVIPFSAQTGEGAEELRREIVKIIEN